jgi:molybdopterin molybdotransferase
MPIANFQLPIQMMDMISEEEARERILNRVQPLPMRHVPLSAADGFFAARDITARLSLPLFDNSAMDGYAVVANDCAPGKRLRVVGEQPAGVERKLSVGNGEAVRIFTGAPLPSGADAIVMQEDVTRDADNVVINVRVETGEFVRRRGCDLSEGQKILDAGERLRAENLALLAAQGISEVEVGGTVRAAIISTGDELVAPGKPIQAGQLYESNSVLLRALVKEIKATAEFVRRVPDTAADLKGALLDGLKHDVLIISGGVSVGDRDLVRPLLREIGAEIDFWRVAIKPGKPFLFGRCENCAIFALPGNPVSAFVTFLVFVRPAILKMMGANDDALFLRAAPARLGSDLSNDGERPHYVRGVLRGGQFNPIGRQESHALYGLSRSNALLRMAAGDKISAGTTISVFLWN